MSSKNTLTEADVLVCGVCFKEDDTAGGDTVDWLECETCGMWAHCGCISCSDNNFYCKNCTLVNHLVRGSFLGFLETPLG